MGLSIKQANIENDQNAASGRRFHISTASSSSGDKSRVARHSVSFELIASSTKKRAESLSYPSSRNVS
jgi:hypothetical protein